MPTQPKRRHRRRATHLELIVSKQQFCRDLQSISVIYRDTFVKNTSQKKTHMINQIKRHFLIIPFNQNLLYLPKHKGKFNKAKSNRAGARRVALKGHFRFRFREHGRFGRRRGRKETKKCVEKRGAKYAIRKRTRWKWPYITAVTKGHER